jgi:alpha-L-glutamate ligase-like protein
MMAWLAALGVRARWIHARSRAVYGLNRRNVGLVYAHNARVHYPIADDKILAKDILAAAGVPVPSTLVRVEALWAIPECLAFLAGRDHFVVKPANGGGGNGIVVVAEWMGEGEWRRAGGGQIDLIELRQHLAAILFGAFSRGAISDRVLVEPRIFPHEVYHGLYADGLCDVRVITLGARPVLAMVRVPTARSGGRANLHQGGLGLAIDLGTGTVHRAVSRGRTLAVHPDTGAPLVGLQLPHWTETLDVAIRAARAVPLGYLGVDIVVDRERGPLVLEINARPGLEIQNVVGRGLGDALAALRADVEGA